MSRQSLQYSLRERALKGITSNNTKKIYAKGIKDFVAWAKTQKIKDINQIDTAVLQAWSDALQADPRQYSADTIHTKLAPICKAAEVPMYQIRKPKRISADNTRGRTGTVRSDREIIQDRYSRVVELQRVVGCRRDELAHLTGADILENGAGVYIRRGKGGKETVQWILPKDREIVRKIFEGVSSEEKVFSKEEMGNRINLHGIRAEHAQRVYRHFAERFAADPESRKKVIEGLIKRWDKGHERLRIADKAVWKRQRDAFVEEVTNPKPYRLRGANAKKATDNGKPTEYDRLALMAASVLSLSHWRINVTVANYMLY